MWPFQSKSPKYERLRDDDEKKKNDSKDKKNDSSWNNKDTQRLIEKDKKSSSEKGYDNPGFKK